MGPWESLGYDPGDGSDLCEPDNELLLKFYPSILADEGRNPEENTCQNRAQYLAELPASQAARKGMKASLSRFNSIWKAHQQLDGSWSSRAFLFLACCLLHGLVSRDSLAEFSTNVHGFSGPENRAAAKKEVRMALATGAKSALLQVTKFCLSDDNKAIARLTKQMPVAVSCRTLEAQRRLWHGMPSRRIGAGWRLRVSIGQHWPTSMRYPGLASTFPSSPRQMQTE